MPRQTLKLSIKQVQPCHDERWSLLFTCACALSIFAAPQLQAQTVYRVVTPDGHVSFSDQPSVKPGIVTSQETNVAPASTSATALPFELRQVVSKFPVTLYASSSCTPCDSGRNHLRTRGVPFTEKSVNSASDADALQRLSGANSLPFLTVGAQQIRGYSNSEWGDYLSAAGYPEQTVLPAGYRNPEPAPLVDLEKPATPEKASHVPEAEPNPSPPPVTEPRVSPNNPAGIQF
jgi:glutaredoxin